MRPMSMSGSVISRGIRRCFRKRRGTRRPRAIRKPPPTSSQPITTSLSPEPLPFVADTDTKPNPVVLSTSDDAPLPAAPAVAPDDTKPIQVISPTVEVPEIPPPRPPDPPPTPERLAPEPMTMPSAPARRDSAHLSVFEIFGLQKPSESSSWPAPVESPARAERDLATPVLYSPPDRTETAPRPESPPEVATGGARDGIVVGWRRRTRRRQTAIRSHN